jgi:hypothetical protein
MHFDSQASCELSTSGFGIEALVSRDSMNCGRSTFDFRTHRLGDAEAFRKRAEI